MLDVILKNGVQIVKFNDPKTKNSLSHKEYQQLADILNSSAEDAKVKVVVLTGERVNDLNLELEDCSLAIISQYH